MTDPSRILLIEDDPEIRRFVGGALHSATFRVFEAETGQRGLIEAATRKPDLVIVDLGLPDQDGVEVIKDLRRWTQMPIIVLSARVEELDKVEALDAGADDYLTKPFGVAELLARVRALLRRQAGGQTDSPCITFGDVAVDLLNRQVHKAGAPVHLSPVEFRLLATLVGHRGKVLTRRQLLQEVWGPGHAEHGHYLRIYMGHLRHKLETDPARPAYFLTELGVGYRFVG